MKYIFNLFLVLVFFQTSNTGQHITGRNVNRGRNVARWPEKKANQPFIVGGEPAKSSDAPWYVRIDSECGGSILNATTIITAAHCYPEYDPDDEPSPTLYVFYAPFEPFGNSGDRKVVVTSIINHPKYGKKRTRFDYDIALMTLETAIPIDNVNVKAIKLPAKDSVIEPGTNVLVAGFGKTSANGSDSKVLQKVVLKIEDRMKCKQNLASQPITFTERMICAQEKGKSTCSGDSGGPLTLNGTNTLVGVVSFAKRTCDATSYYTRVSKFIDFITKNKSE